MANLDESLVAVVVNSAQFEPPQPKNISKFSFLLASKNFSIASFPYLTIGAREPPDAIEKVLTFQN